MTENYKHVNKQDIESWFHFIDEGFVNVFEFFISLHFTSLFVLQMIVGISTRTNFITFEQSGIPENSKRVRTARGLSGTMEEKIVMFSKRKRGLVRVLVDLPV